MMEGKYFDLLESLLTSIGYSVSLEEGRILISGDTGITVVIEKEKIQGLKIDTYTGVYQVDLIGMNAICFDTEGIAHGAIFKKNIAK